MQRLREYGGPEMLPILAQVRKSDEHKKIPVSFASHAGKIGNCLYLMGQPVRPDINRLRLHLSASDIEKFHSKCRTECKEWISELLDLLTLQGPGQVFQGTEEFPFAAVHFRLEFEKKGWREMAEDIYDIVPYVEYHYVRPSKGLYPSTFRPGYQFFFYTGIRIQIRGMRNSKYYSKDEMIPLLCDWLKNDGSLVLNGSVASVDSSADDWRGLLGSSVDKWPSHTKIEEGQALMVVEEKRQTWRIPILVEGIKEDRNRRPKDRRYPVSLTFSVHF
jgi:hypothetical protein